jgi:hypothetical protein
MVIAVIDSSECVVGFAGWRISPIPHGLSMAAFAAIVKKADRPQPTRLCSSSGPDIAYQMANSAYFVLVLGVFCAGCDIPAIEPGSSLVGTNRIPSAAILSREVIYIAWDEDNSDDHLLSYELRPDDTLKIVHSRYGEGDALRETISERNVRVSPEIARRARAMIWRVRPAKMVDQVDEVAPVRPVGCNPSGLHDVAELGVTFISKGNIKNSNDDRYGAFELPYSSSCNTSAAIQARKVVWDAIRMLSANKVNSSFDRMH